MRARAQRIHYQFAIVVIEQEHDCELGIGRADSSKQLVQPITIIGEPIGQHKHIFKIGFEK
jgi:hypothetical protein